MRRNQIVFSLGFASEPSAGQSRSQVSSTLRTETHLADIDSQFTVGYSLPKQVDILAGQVIIQKAETNEGEN